MGPWRGAEKGRVASPVPWRRAIGKCADTRGSSRHINVPPRHRARPVLPWVALAASRRDW